MKKCICCGAESEASASVCTNCGEGSWSNSHTVVLRPKDKPNELSAVIDPKEPNVKPTISEAASPPVVNDDPDTAVDAPRVPSVRRGKRPN
jgi:hypothetical protein